MSSIAVTVDARVRRAGWLALAAAVMTVGLIVYGGWVRASGSGLGCPDWPLCEGTALPTLEGDTAIEFGHRFYAGMTMLVTAAAAVFAVRARRVNPGLARLLGGAFVLIVVQAGLGGATVLTELEGGVRLAHLIFAMSTLGLLTAGALVALDVAPSHRPGVAVTSVLLGLGAAVLFFGGGIVGSDLSPACPSLPFCDGSTSAEGAFLHNIHRAGGAVLLVGLAYAGVLMARARGRGGPSATRLAVGMNHTAAALLLAQGFVGIAVVKTDAITEHWRVLHLGIATLAWWALVTSWVLALRVRAQ